MSVVLITGSQGQLGAALKATFVGHSLVIPVFYSKAMLDITNADQIESCVKAHKVKYIINCAAYTNVALAEKEIASCFKVNTIGTGYLAEIAAKYDIVLWHISTDYVFGATRGRPLEPNDPTDPLNQYGRSKQAGEERVIAAGIPHFYIIRTAWLYGEQGDNFFTKIVRLAQQQRAIQIVDDQISSPTYVYDLAITIWQMIEKITRDSPKSYPSGIYHYTNEGVASWYDFAYVILTALPNRCALERRSSSMELKRPYYSVLSKCSFREIFQIKIPHWQHSLSVCLKKWQEIQ